MGLICSSRLLVSRHLSVIDPDCSLRDTENGTRSRRVHQSGWSRLGDQHVRRSDFIGEGLAGRSFRMPEGVDGILRANGILRFNETIDM